MKKIIYTFLFLFSVSATFSQTADVTEGCAPLVVNFTGPTPTLSNYFWDFGDGANADLANPSRQFIESGIYNVKLTEGENGPLVGEIVITVFPEIIVDIDASIKEGCAPQTISFTNLSVVDPGITVTGYLWDFGDGGSSNLQNPSHTYLTAGKFDISLNIITTNGTCNQLEVFDNYIQLSERVDVDFNIDPELDLCKLPLTTPIIHESENYPAFTYTWDFGNGQTGSGYFPQIPTYTTKGIYTITLTVDNNDGCIINLEKEIIVGPPIFDITMPDTVCLNQVLPIINNTKANSFIWSFGAGASKPASQLKKPSVFYSTGGLKNIMLTAKNGDDCQSDTVIQVYVEEPNVNFTIDPLLSCEDPTNYVITAIDKSHSKYYWNNIEDDFEYIFEYDDPDRDSFYVFEPDTFYIKLQVESKYGCVAERLDSFYFDFPDAEFTPSTSRGCAPLLVNISEESLSRFPIISYTYNWGDGTSDTYTPTEIGNISHTYNTPGEYYVKSNILTDNGCFDESAGIWIYVGEKLDATFTLPSNQVCMYDTINLVANNLDDRIDSWHFDIDGSVNHCAENPEYIHVFKDRPGQFPITLNVEYNGCYNTYTVPGGIEVQGSKANIKYMTNCESPYSVMFQDSSFNSTLTTWFINGDTIVSDSFHYVFPERGDYEIKMETINENDNCKADRDSLTVYIREIIAEFAIDTLLCENRLYTLNASASQDVDERCHQGYLWYLPGSRPREKGVPIIDHPFSAGVDSILLIVEDINGCTNSKIKNVRTLGLYPDFTFDKEKICIPSDVQFTDLTVTDTTVIDWSWSFSDTGDQNPLFAFEENPFGLNSIDIELLIEDAHGCLDSITKTIDIYNPISFLNLSPRQFCVGSEISFSATDFTLGGSSLAFDWQIENIGNSSEKEFSLLIDKAGKHNVTLNYEEIGTGCSGTIDTSIIAIAYPTAIIDDVDPTVCYKTQLQWTGSNSIIDPNEPAASYLWLLNGNQFSPFADPIITLQNKGVYELSLVVTSATGCADTTSTSITALGPQGTLTADNTKVCKGEDISFSILNMVDVDSIVWDSGQGFVTSQDPPFVYAYDQYPESGTTIMNVSLYSEEGCEIVYQLPIEIYKVLADFEFEVDTTGCPGIVNFYNNSTNGNSYNWDFGDGNISAIENPVHTYNQAGIFDVSLNILDNMSLCEDRISMPVELEGLGFEQVVMPNLFSPNGDMHQDYLDIYILNADGKPIEDQEIVRSNFEVNVFQIFNRWGKLVYDNQTPTTGWNGRIDGDQGKDEASEDVYFYYINYNYNCKDAISSKGNVTLIR
jgi:gliding motility-associated-like protein